jgi:hypothetical protein
MNVRVRVCVYACVCVYFPYHVLVLTTMHNAKTHYNTLRAPAAVGPTPGIAGPPPPPPLLPPPGITGPTTPAPTPNGTSGWHALSYDDGTGCCWASGPEVGRAGDCVNFASSVPRSTVPRYTFFLGMLRAGFRGALEGTVPGALRRGAADYASAQGALVSPHNFCWSRLSVLRILGWAVRPTWAMASSSARVLESRGRKPAFAGNVAAVAAVLLRFARSKLNTLRSKRFIMYTSERDVRTMVDKIKPYVSLINESRPHSCLSLAVSTLQCKCAFVLPTLTLDGQWVCAFLPTEVGRAPA